MIISCANSMLTQSALVSATMHFKLSLHIVFTIQNTANVTEKVIILLYAQLYI